MDSDGFDVLAPSPLEVSIVAFNVVVSEKAGFVVGRLGDSCTDKVRFRDDSVWGRSKIV